MKRSMSALIVAIIAAATVLGTAASASASAGSDAAAFVSKINAERRSRGLHALTVMSDLTSIAVQHSKQMEQSGYIYHSSNLPGEVHGNWQMLGENVGEGPDVDSLHQAFMNSAPHRANILEPKFNQIGVGVAYAADGTLYVTEEFAERTSTVHHTVHHTTTTHTYSSHPVAVVIPARPSAPAAAPAQAQPVGAQETFASLVRMLGYDGQS